jgi:O-antigen/teichoic acid export membrane protein
MHMGMYITFMGATITVLINVLFIPKFGMYACAWATLITYCSMMLMSYWLGQRHFAVPYALSRLGTYLGVMLLLFGIQYGIWHMIYNVWIHLASATLFMGVFLLVVAKLERSELQGMPVIGKFLKRG